MSEDAEALAALGKTSDAINKLLDYEVKVDQLEARTCARSRQTGGPA